MGTFNTTKNLYADPSLIPAIATRIQEAFEAEGYEVLNQPLLSGGADLSLSKGGIFKSVLGMKTALKIRLTTQGEHIFFDASVGIFGQQVIPTIISLFFAWPVAITQIWGLVRQSKIDDRALEIAEDVIRENKGNVKSSFSSAGSKRFCTECGTQVPEGASFCPNCGNKL